MLYITVVRRAARASAGQPAAIAGQVGTSSEVSIGARLQNLETLHRDGALTDEEYASKRGQIVAEI